MQSKPPTSKLLIYIYILLAVASLLLIIVTASLIHQGTKTSQQEKILSNDLLPTIFDLQRLDHELIEFQRMHPLAAKEENTHDTPLGHTEEMGHILFGHLQPIHRFIVKIGNNPTEAQILKSAMERLNTRYLHFESTVNKLLNEPTVDNNEHAIAQSIEALSITIRQITRLYQREASKITNTLNDLYQNGIWRVTGVIALAFLLGLLLAIKIISLSKSAIKRQQISDTELLKHKENLEQLIHERTSELELSNKELQAYSYSIVHDLRPPLRAITSFSQILLEDIRKKLNDEEQGHFKRIISAGIHMSNLIDDILRLSTVTRATLNIQKIDLSTIAIESAHEHSHSKTEKKIDLRIQDNVIAYADPTLIQLAIDHLVSNAIKYSRQKEKPAIEFGTTDIDGKTTYFVRDNGVGFNMEYASKLFQAFERVQSKNSLDGSGVGLALVQRVITKHGGRIWADATVDQGATFYFTLPEN